MESNEKILVKINAAIKLLTDNFLHRGYVCGIINGLRFARYLITKEQIIFERNDVQKESADKDIDLKVENELNKILGEVPCTG